MDSKKGQKLSKATVATVLAASGVIVAMPIPTNAYSFSDLNPYSDYYEPILDLANRKIATGFSDGTFKPNVAITREDAAKMLALTIDVNITNPKNPGFKDVAMSNPNYRYIAALAEAGVINGYSDKTFKPKEPITRGQMAKILTLGFKFGVSTKLNHGFKDVSSKNANAYFIQTLYDLNVTKGKTPVSFDPFNTVTRGQMATFIWRAEKADRGNPVYTVGDIVDNQIYINGVAHTISSHLRSILNASNKNVLKGAYIEGNFSGNTVNNITKLTINASGNSSRLLALDGGYSSFAGELIVTGSYVRFKNINFTGRVEVAEAPRRSLASYENVRIASVGNVASFIDWSKPTVPKNEDFLNPIENESLQDKPDPTKPAHLQKYKERMSNLKNYVDFENSDIRHLYVSADRTFVKANYEIDRLTLQGNVANVELYASPNAMYIDTDYNVSVFGVHDIRYVYKNTLKNVSFKTDSTYDYYYITSSNGYTDIGPHVYISTAIIPSNKTVNDVFDDYKTDNPNIGYVEDENGKAVDRDPVENTVIPDVTEPRITQLDVVAGGSMADVSLTANEDGTYYYVIKKANEKAPSINEIKTGGTKHSGNGPIVMDEQVKFSVSGLDTKTDYVIYAIVIDKADNVSQKEEREFTTIDNRPPTFNITNVDAKPGGKRFEFTTSRMSEAGEIFYLVRQEKEIDNNMTVDYVINNKTGSRKISQPGDQVFDVREYGIAPNLSAVQPSTDYVVYAVMVDLTGNKMRVVEAKQVKTDVPDTTHPYVLDPPLLELGDSDKGYFYITVSEELDKETAENPDNYILSGTGIVNIVGHKEMKPSEVQYVGKRIRLTIPSVSSLVKGDTIVATVLKGVKDLAENEFENKDVVPVGMEPRNYAQYNHSDPLLPKLDIRNVITGPNKYEIEVSTNKAGTYYYMILPDDYDFVSEDITSRDFVDEFSNDPKVITGKFQTPTPLGKVDDYIATGQNPAALGTFKFDVTKPGSPPRDPFKSYKIYMVLKDRSGQLSEIMNRSLIDDVKPPLVTNLSINNFTGSDTRIILTANVDEKTNFYVLPVKKYIKKTVNGREVYELNTAYFDASGNLKDITTVLNTTANAPDLFEKYKTLGARDIGGSESQGYVEKIPLANELGLQAHEEYGFYIGAVDTIGNFTILQRSSAPVLAEDEPKGPQMKTTLYMDGTKPKIESLVFRELIPTRTDTVFTITFSESILRQEGTISNGVNVDYNKSLLEGTIKPSVNSFMEVLDESGVNIASQFIVESYTVGTLGKATLKLSTSSSAAANQTLKIRMKGIVGGAEKVSYDYMNNKSEIQNEFDLTNLGHYYNPVLSNSNKIISAVIGDLMPGSTSLSRKLFVDLALFDSIIGSVPGEPEVNVDQFFYYAVLDRDPGVSGDRLAEIIKRSAESRNISLYPNYMQYADKVGPVSNIEKNGVHELVIRDEFPNAGFREGNRVYLFTYDNYGNVIWAKDHANLSNAYMVITK